MPFTVEVSLDLEVSPQLAFDTLCDHSAWPAWMPRSFLPVGASVGALTVGGKVQVRIDRLPVASTLHVTVVDRGREIAWRGGLEGVLLGEHSCLFEPAGAGTRVRSVEKWSGVIAAILKPLLRAGAARVGRAQLAGLREGALARARAG